jgi:peptidyl-tRNA hydrolase
VTQHGIVCLPPRPMSERSPLLEALMPFTDAPRPQTEPPPPDDDAPAMLYVIRRGVMKTAGKAMAQAGHASLMCVYEWSDVHPEAFAAWRAAGHPGELVVATGDHWQRLKQQNGAVVVRDGGRTQVEPGTETVIALVPEPRTNRRPI